LTVTLSVQLLHVAFGVQVIGALASGEVPIELPFKSHCAPGWGRIAMTSGSERLYCVPIESAHGPKQKTDGLIRISGCATQLVAVNGFETICV
jgi:hypothetical protein